MSPSKIIFYLCVSLIAGISCASFTTAPPILIGGFLLVGVIVIFISGFMRNKRGLVIGFCLLCLALGSARFLVAQSVVDHDPIRLINDGPDKISLTGKIIDESDVRDSFQKLKVAVTPSESIVLVTTNRRTRYQYLDEITLMGKLKTPAVFPARAGGEDFNYKNYLLKDGIYSVMDFPTIEVVSQKHHYTIFSWAYEKILWLKELLHVSINKTFSANDRSILEGIILGENKNMTQEMKFHLNAAGLSHLTAISGGNIIIASDMVFILLIAIGLWRGQAFYGALVSVWFYVVITGLPASGVRAAIMASLFLCAEKIGRPYTGLRAITLAAAGMLFINPVLLRYDIGFQLSFLASLGIIYAKSLFDGLLHPIVTRIFAKEPRTKIMIFLRNSLRTLGDILSVTLAAQLFVLPVIVYNFGVVSLSAPLSNILVLPIIPWLMGFGFMCAVFGIVSPFLAWVLYFPTKILLVYFFTVASVFSQSWMTLTFSHVSWLWLPVYYLLLGAAMFFWHKKKSENIFQY